MKIRLCVSAAVISTKGTFFIKYENAIGIISEKASPVGYKDRVGRPSRFNALLSEMGRRRLFGGDLTKMPPASFAYAPSLTEKGVLF